MKLRNTFVSGFTLTALAFALSLLVVSCGYTPPEPVEPECKDAVVALDTCASDAGGPVQDCYETLKNAIIDEGLGAGHANDQARLQELWDEYEQCLDNITEEEEADEQPCDAENRQVEQACGDEE